MARPLHCYAYVDAPFDLVSRVLAEDAHGVLQGATDDAAVDAGELSRTLEVAVAGFEVGKDVVIEVGDFDPRQVTRSVVPLSWHAETGRLLFPEMAAELEVASLSLDPPLTQVTLSGTYTPPLGAVGAGADRVLLGRLAEAAVHRFTHEIADELRRRVEALPPGERV